MTYFVTGATGFLGGALARRLRTDGHEVRALARDPARASDLAAMGALIARGDVSDKSSMREAMRGADGVFHVAGWYKLGVKDRAAAVATNIDGTRNVLELMQELRIPKGVYTSTLAVNSDTHGQVVDESYRFAGRHLTLYDWSKAEAHRVAEDFVARGLPLVIVQPGLIYGPGDTSGVRTMLIQYLRRKMPMVPAGAAYSWAHVSDEVEGHLRAMDRGQPGRNYFIAGPVHTLTDALKIAEGITGIPAGRIALPPALLRALSALMRPIDAMLTLPPSLSPESLRILGGVSYLGSSARARAELGWEPRLLKEGLTETLRHEMRQLGMSPSF
jgi:nucleoside-diphosphate-sugar epimerase